MSTKKTGIGYSNPNRGTTINTTHEPMTNQSSPREKISMKTSEDKKKGGQPVCRITWTPISAGSKTGEKV